MKKTLLLRGKEISVYYEATRVKRFSDLPEIMHQLMESFG